MYATMDHIRFGLTKILNNRLQFIQVRLVLSNILDLFLDTLQDPNSGSVIVNLSSALQSFRDDLSSWDEIVGETVVESSLEFKEVRTVLEECSVSVIECLERFGLVSMSTGTRVESKTYSIG
jgi:hypothetical protein